MTSHRQNMEPPTPVSTSSSQPGMRLSLALAIGAGLVLHTVALLIKAPDRTSSFFVGLLIFSLAPYAVAVLLASFRRTTAAALGFALGVLAGDLYLIYSVFVAPRGSMTGYFFFLMPALNLLALGPLGALVSWIGAKLIAGRSGHRQAAVQTDEQADEQADAGGQRR